LFDHIRTKAGALINTKDTGYAANDAADHATHNCTDRACRAFTIPRTPLDASGNTLGLGHNREEDRDNNSEGSDKTADHEDSLCGDW
jgi:hypothetical protein